MIDVRTQAILLLTTHLAKPVKNQSRSTAPLTPAEWGRLSLWLGEKGVSPESLLNDDDPVRLLEGWCDRSVSLARIRYLLERAGALALAWERWQRAGLWAITRSDADYPTRLKRFLGVDSAPVLFGCGNRSLLDRGGVAVVGSRNASDDDLEFAARLGGEIALQGLTVVSGGARGVDDAALGGALDQEGTGVCVLADSLLRAATSLKYRKGLMSLDVVLVSPFSPEAGFDVGNAMARNKYIYCLADAAVVVSASNEKGGTWNGAVENLRRRWVPLWVKRDNDEGSGNFNLVRQGARWLPDGRLDLDILTRHQEDVESPATGGQQLPIWSPQHAAGHVAETSAPAWEETKDKPGESSEARSGQAVETGNVSQDSYFLFLGRLRTVLGELPSTADQIGVALAVDRKRLHLYLNRAIEEGHIKKLRSPVRYQWRVPSTVQARFFVE